MISFQLPALVWALLGVQFLAALIAVCRIWCSAHRIKRSFEKEVSENEILETAPSLSLVVYAKDDEPRLREFLGQVMEQEYPGELDVVVIYDSDGHTARSLAERVEKEFPRVHVTFLPQDSKNVSRVKLAITLGMKGAKGELVLVTTSDCHPRSNRWLIDMATPCVNPEVELVLGSVVPRGSGLRGLGGRYAMFDWLMSEINWLNFAIKGKAYRGDGKNMLERKIAFFLNRGFAKSAFLKSGEDDIFVNEISTPANTRVTLFHSSIIDWDCGDHARKKLEGMKIRRDFTSKFLPRRPFVCAALFSFLQWLTLGAGVAALCIGLPNLMPLVIAAVLVMAFFLLESFAIVKTARCFGVSGLGWLVPLFLLWRPIGNDIFRIKNRHGYFRQYTMHKIKC